MPYAEYRTGLPLNYVDDVVTLSLSRRKIGETVFEPNYYESDETNPSYREALV